MAKVAAVAFLAAASVVEERARFGPIHELLWNPAGMCSVVVVVEGYSNEPVEILCIAIDQRCPACVRVGSTHGSRSHVRSNRRARRRWLWRTCRTTQSEMVQSAHSHSQSRLASKFHSWPAVRAVFLAAIAFVVIVFFVVVVLCVGRVAQSRRSP